MIPRTDPGYSLERESPADDSVNRSPESMEEQTRPRDSYEPAIYLTQPEVRGGGGRTSALARFLRLDVWGTSLLNSRARHEISGAATLLAIVFLFELTAWSTLFNVILYGAAWALGWRTLIALSMGFVLAMAVLVFERGIIIADASAHRTRLVVAILVRLTLILLSALATSQSVELLVFGNEIDERLRDEEARAEALLQLERLEEDDKRANQSVLEQATKESRTGELYARVVAADAAVKMEEAKRVPNEKKAQIEGEIERLSTQITGLKNRIAKSDPTDPGMEQMQQNLGNLSMSMGKWQKELIIEKRLDEDRLKPLAEARQVQATLRKAFDEAVEARKREIQTQRTATGDQTSKRQKWIRTILRAPVGEALPPEPGISEAWNPYRAGFVRRHALLADLLGGRPPAWPPSEEKFRRQAADLFRIDDPRLDDPATAQRIAVRTVDFRRIYLMAFLVALFVPLLTLAFKLILGRELHLYYSTMAQARAGNAEAVAVLLAEGASKQLWPEGEDA